MLARLSFHFAGSLVAQRRADVTFAQLITLSILTLIHERRLKISSRQYGDQHCSR